MNIAAKEFRFPKFNFIDEQEALKRDMEFAEVEKQQREKEALQRYLSCGVRERFQTATLDNFVIRNENDKFVKNEIAGYIKSLKAGNISDLWLCGSPGTGKTHLACSIAREMCSVTASVVYSFSYYLKDEYDNKKSYNSGETRQEFAIRYGKYDFLVIDEVGRFKDNELDCLFAIINERYERRKPTVLISNMNKDTLGGYLGKALVDRAREMCRTVEFCGESYRETLRKDNFIV